MTPGLFWSLKCLILWGISSSWQKHRSATNQQDQSLATELVRSHEVLCLLSLSPCLRIIRMSLCPWKCVGCSWYASTWLWKHWLSSWELQWVHLRWGAVLPMWPGMGDSSPGSEAMDPRATQLSQDLGSLSVLGLLSTFDFLFFLFLFLLLLYRNRNNSKIST